MNIYLKIFVREIKVSMKRWADILTVVIMFVLVALIFPLTVGSDQMFLI